ncbi:DUF445 domain-containing protein [Corynebacterium sp. sy039]|uniref:DUF445 domain-containing protein n=1 Tax=Corynebacterium sp. sy039 TaxID=2599641 RepID=UPI00352CCC39
MQAAEMPGFSAQDEVARRKALARHKAIATGLLIIAALVFFACRFLETRGSGAWVGFVRAAAEAGMVGGLADWFAVTALFRYPLGLKIPHTALIRNKKDQVGAALSSFVSDNFLNTTLITQKVAQAQIPHRIAQWMIVETHAQKVSREVGKFIVRVVDNLDPRDAEALINTVLIEKLAQPQWGPPAGKVLEQLIHEGKVAPIIDEFVQWAHKKAVASEDLIHRLSGERAPKWAPKFVNDLVGAKIYQELVSWTQSVVSDKNHEARAALERFIQQFAEDLQHDPVMIGRVEDIKTDIMNSRSVQEATQAAWRYGTQALTQAASDPHSPLRHKIAQSVVEWGHKILDDEQLRAQLDRRVIGATTFLADNYAGEVSNIISETINRWDADEASEKIELMVGKDLQYIRLNGTVVGALAGLIIHSISFVVFGG